MAAELEVFDSLVESALRLALSKPSQPRQSGLTRLNLRDLKKPPSKLGGEEITLDRIPHGLRASLRGCIVGKTPWPFFMWGTPGSGKTCAALSLTQFLNEGDYVYFKVRLLCEAMNSLARGDLEWTTEGRGGKWFPEAWRKCHLITPALVILDEIGAREKVTDAHYEAVLTVLDHRQNKPLILISNLTPAELEKVYDGRIVSRMSAGTMIEVSGKDQRM